MIKQIDRVIGDLVRQVEEFRKAGGNPICVGFVGVNYAENYTSYEGERPWPTDGKKYKHPVQEAAAAEARLREKALPSFDEFLFLRFRAADVPWDAAQLVPFEAAADIESRVVLMNGRDGRNGRNGNCGRHGRVGRGVKANLRFEDLKFQTGAVMQAAEVRTEGWNRSFTW